MSHGSVSRRWDGTPDWRVEELLAEDFAMRYANTGKDAWKIEGSCNETDPEAFFPEKGGSTRDAKRVCRGAGLDRGCPVRAECLAYALVHEERFGIWGGESERDRRAIKRREGANAGEDMYERLAAEALELIEAGRSDHEAARFLQVSIRFVEVVRVRAEARARAKEVGEAAASAVA